MEVLGDAVLDLTADLTQLARKLAEAKAMTEASMRDMGGSVLRFETTAQQTGAGFDRGLVQPITQSFLRLSRGIESAYTSIGNSYAQLGQQRTKMMDQLSKDAATFSRSIGPQLIRDNANKEAAALKVEQQNLTAFVMGRAASIRELQKQQVELSKALSVPVGQGSGDKGLITVPQRSGYTSPAYLAGGGQGLVGARGTNQPGSINNPIVTTLESSDIAGLGTRGAAIGAPVKAAPEARTGGAAAATPIPYSYSSQDAALVAALNANTAALRGAGGGGGGGGAPPVALGGGGGANDRNWLSTLLWGGGGRLGWGRLGFGAGAGAGSLASFGGLDPLHALTTAGAVVASAGTGLAGAGLLGLGSAGQLAVGGGSDLAVMKSTIADTKTLYTQYTALQTAVATYGANSRQAAVAQSTLNQSMQDLGPAAGVELALAKNVMQLDTLWDQTTANARKQAVNILDQVVQLGKDYVPRVAAAAYANLSIINDSLKPLFSWLEGPQGVGIWNNLETNFRKSLPAAMDVFNQSIQLILRVTSLASNYTGVFVRHLDELVTRLNKTPDSTLNTYIGKLVDDFRMWESLIKHLGQDIYDLFKNDAGTGKSIVTTIDAMLVSLGNWERSTAGKAQIHNIFEVHKQEVLALLQIIPELFRAIGPLYLAVAPLATQAITGIVRVLTGFVGIIEDLGKLSPIIENMIVIPLGGALVLAKLTSIKDAWAAIKTVIAALRTEYLLLTGAEQAAAVAGAEAAGAGAVGAGAAGAAGAAKYLAPGASAATGAFAGEAAGVGGLAAGLKANLLPAALWAGIGIAAAQGIGSELQKLIPGHVGQAIGTGVKDVGTGAAVGAGLGRIFGPEGVIPGALVGGLVGGLVDFVNSAKPPDEGKIFANRFLAPLGPAIQAQYGDAIRKAYNASEAANAQINTDARIAAARQAQARGNPLARSRIPGGGPLPTLLNPTGASAADIKAAYNAAFNLGRVSAMALEAGLQSGKHFTQLGLLNDFLASLKGMPAASRLEGAKSMISWAEGLVQNGKLPAKQLDAIIASLEQQFPQLSAFLQAQGLKDSKQVADSQKYTAAQNTLKQSLLQFRADWVDYYGKNEIDYALNSNNINANAVKAMAYLKNVIATGTHDQRVAAEAELKLLKQHWSDSLAAQVTDTRNKFADMGKAMHDHLVPAINQASSNITKLASNIAGAMASGVITTQQGMKDIATALGTTLDAFGVTTPKLLISGASQIAGLIAAGVPPAAAYSYSNRPTAQGGLIPIGQTGQPGRDSVPLNVGGTPIIVAPGEKVAVFNRHQEPIMNRALVREGYAGLPGLFNQVQTPNYMAKGGMVPGYAAGGMANQSFPFPKGEAFSWMRVDAGQDLEGPAGGPVLAIGPGNVSQASDAFSGFGPFYATEQITGGPLSGRGVYYGHTKATHLGPVRAGQQIAVTQGIDQSVDRCSGRMVGARFPAVRRLWVSDGECCSYACIRTRNYRDHWRRRPGFVCSSCVHSHQGSVLCFGSGSAGYRCPGRYESSYRCG